MGSLTASSLIEKSTAFHFLNSSHWERMKSISPPFAKKVVGLCDGKFWASLTSQAWAGESQNLMGRAT